jgi:hypothetical protein
MFRRARSAPTSFRVVTALVSVAFLVGCGPTEKPSPSTTFPTEKSGEQWSKADVLAEASAAYGRYLVAADQILADGGLAPERIENFASPEFAKQFSSEVAQYSSAGLKAVGSTMTKSVELQSWSSSGGRLQVSLYICEDVSGVDVVDASGASVVSPDRDATTPYAVVLEGDDIGALILNSKDLWTGADFCDA